MGDFDGTTSVPNWAMRLIYWALGSLGTGATLTLAFTVHHVFALHEGQAELRREVGAIKVKEADVVSMVNSVRADIKDLSGELATVQRKLDVLSARMP